MVFQKASMQKSSDLFLVIGMTIAAVVVTLLGWSTPIRALFMLPFVFLFPGYSLVSAVLPRGELPLTTRLTLALPLSLAITAMGGLFLHYTNGELTPGSWLLLLSIVTGVLCAVALLRRQPAATEAPTRPLHIKPGHAAMVGAAALMLVSAVVIARVGTINLPVEGFTQLWLLPAASGTNPETVQLGIENHENTSVRYRLQLRSGDIVVDQWDDIQLASGEEWETLVTLSSGIHVQGLDALLYRDDAPATVYRRVSLAPDPVNPSP
ncbi:MAG: DUF1616 domain-containing protein [Pleurocapsa minor GSE-CHR-MK-17-07R]|jgi:uncharacterized membrane protein|nr:DUF1616 domain-containing protein [Pleurocapsa minor GSE-CHR-MK 17-07R]